MRNVITKFFPQQQYDITSKSIIPLLHHRCNKEPQKYCCPRCNILYCSLNCYKHPTHTSCSESFYRDCVITEMAQRNQPSNGGIQPSDDPDDVQQMYDILRRQAAIGDSSDEGDDVEDSDDDADATATDLATRLQGIDIDDPDAVWHSLSASERNEFEKLVRRDDVDALIPSYEPWWCSPQKLVQDMAEDTISSSIPPILPSIADFSAISTKPPADCVRYNLVNVLAAYALAVRCYNGDHLANTQATANLLIAVSENLSTNRNFATQPLAVESVVGVADTFGLSGEMADVGLVLREDVEKIVNGCYVSEALSDVHLVLTMAKMRTTTTVAAGEFTQKFLATLPSIEKGVGRSKLNNCIRKVEYFLSYAKDKL